MPSFTLGYKPPVGHGGGGGGGGGELYNKITIPCLIPYGSTLTSVIEGGGAGVDPGFLGGGAEGRIYARGANRFLHIAMPSLPLNLWLCR